ncbi:hypothetical protein [Vibrio aphrogenes]|uniref:hypothetical protein n=1 Tax=Vibrio aphrogenes TaxID=1891186 RepID=UPI000B35DFF9|nr:hypothetical protein [Vibrio aphrogenes]
MNDRNERKTLDTLLTLRNIIPHPPAAPMTYHELVDALVDMGITTSYHSVYRMLKHQGVLNLLDIERVKTGRAHGFRHRGSLLDKFSHHGLIADLIIQYLPHLLPPKVASQLKTHLAHHLVAFTALDEAYPDKRWKDKLDIQIDALGSWLTSELSPKIETLLSALYRDEPVWVEYYSLDNPAQVHKEKVMPQHLVVTTQDCELGYLSVDNPLHRGKGKLSRMPLTQIHTVTRCY